MMRPLSEYALIQVECTGLPMGYRQHSYRLVKPVPGYILCAPRNAPTLKDWRGPILLDGNFLDKRLNVGEIVHLGAYRLRVVEAWQWFGQYECRLDSPYWWVYLYSSRAARALRFIYYRLIITAHVWGLAKHDNMLIPSWRDVYVLDRMAKRWKSLQSRLGSVKRLRSTP